jgi:hypothetical protein
MHRCSPVWDWKTLQFRSYSQAEPFWLLEMRTLTISILQTKIKSFRYREIAVLEKPP